MCTGRDLISFIKHNQLEDVEVRLYIAAIPGVIEEGTYLKLDIVRDTMIEDLPGGKVLFIG